MVKTVIRHVIVLRGKPLMGIMGDTIWIRVSIIMLIISLVMLKVKGNLLLSVARVWKPGIVPLIARINFTISTNRTPLQIHISFVA